MKITFLNEAGVFGSYKKTTTQSNIDNVKNELARDVSRHLLEKRCDELAELYLDMLNEVNSQANAISSKFNYNAEPGNKPVSNLRELSNYVADMYFTMSRKKEMQINIIKNVYCNRPAIEYMISNGCFILPLIEPDNKFRSRYWTFFDDCKEIIPYKNMVKTIAAAAEKVIKSHLSKFPSYTTVIPNNVKIIIVKDIFKYRGGNTERQFVSYMGIAENSVNDVEFTYPGQGSSCLSHILNNYTILTCSYNGIRPVKSEEHIWKGIANPSPWMLNKIVLSTIKTNISTVSANNFYGIKILKFAVDSGIISNNYYIDILMDNPLKHLQSINILKQEVSNNGLDNIVRYEFYDVNSHVETLCKIGKEITSKQAEQEGISVQSLNRRVYEFDYNNSAEVKSAAKEIIGGCSKFLTDAKIKKMAEDKMEEYLPVLMSKVLAAKPNCISSSNKILLCEYNQRGNAGMSNIRVVINTSKIKIDTKGNLVFYIAIDFKLPVRGVNPKYNSKISGMRTSGKNYEYITGKKIKIEIPL